MRYFQLLDHYGLNAVTGEPEPLKVFGVTIGSPRVVAGELLAVPQHVGVPAVEPFEQGGPVTDAMRTLKTNDPRVVQAVFESGAFREVDPPVVELPRKPKSKED